MPQIRKGRGLYAALAIGQFWLAIMASVSASFASPLDLDRDDRITGGCCPGRADTDRRQAGKGGLAAPAYQLLIISRVDEHSHHSAALGKQDRGRPAPVPR